MQLVMLQACKRSRPLAADEEEEVAPSRLGVGRQALAVCMLSATTMHSKVQLHGRAIAARPALTTGD